MIYIVAGYTHEGDSFYPQLFFPHTGAKQVDRTIPLVSAKTALKYANIWRNERLTQLNKYMSEPTKDYISVLEAFKAEKAQELAEKKEAQDLRNAKAKARKDAALRPAVELFDQLFERYKSTRGLTPHREAATSLAFSVHGGYMIAGIHYKVRETGDVELLLQVGWQSSGGSRPAFVKRVSEDRVHDLFPELLSNLAKIELEYPQWAPSQE